MAHKICIDGLNYDEAKQAFKRFFYMVSDLNSNYLYEEEKKNPLIPFVQDAEQWVVGYRGNILTEYIPKEWNVIFPKYPLMTSTFWRDHEGNHLEVLVEECDLTSKVMDRMNNEIQYLDPKTRDTKKRSAKRLT